MLRKLINPSFIVKGNGRINIESDTIQKVEYNTNDVQLNIVIKKLQALNLTMLERNKIIPDLEYITEIVRFRGDFCPIIKGKSISDRLANYERVEQIEWNCLTDDYNISVITAKGSLISNTPISYTLSDKNASLFLDGFGSILSKKKKLIKILPIIIGTRLRIL